MQSLIKLPVALLYSYYVHHRKFRVDWKISLDVRPKIFLFRVNLRNLVTSFHLFLFLLDLFFIQSVGMLQI